MRRVSEQRSQRTEPGAKDEKQRKRAQPAQAERARDWDEIDEASLESFPASDPPVGWAGRDKPSTH